MVEIYMIDGHRFQVDLSVEVIVEKFQEAQNNGRLAGLKRADGVMSKAINPSHVLRVEQIKERSLRSVDAA